MESGLDENTLIPNKDDRDRNIFDYINTTVIEPSRPQSAVTGVSTVSKMSNSLVRDCDPMGLDQTMRSSFYSTRDGFNNKKGNVVDSIKINNVLELSDEDVQKIKQIREFMKEQLQGMQDEIEELQKLIMQGSIDIRKTE